MRFVYYIKELKRIKENNERLDENGIKR